MLISGSLCTERRNQPYFFECPMILSTHRDFLKAARAKWEERIFRKNP